MLVKSLKGANEDPAILQDTSHSIVNVLQHLAALSHGHDCFSTKSNVHRKISGSLRPKGRLQIKVGCRFSYKQCKLGQKLQIVDGACFFDFFFPLGISSLSVLQYCFNHPLVSQLRMPVSILLENPPQGVAAAEIASDTADTPGCSVKLSFYV